MRAKRKFAKRTPFLPQVKVSSFAKSIVAVGTPWINVTCIDTSTLFLNWKTMQQLPKINDTTRINSLSRPWKRQKQKQRLETEFDTGIQMFKLRWLSDCVSLRLVQVWGYDACFAVLLGRAKYESSWIRLLHTDWSNSQSLLTLHTHSTQCICCLVFFNIIFTLLCSG